MEEASSKEASSPEATEPHAADPARAEQIRKIGLAGLAAVLLGMSATGIWLATRGGDAEPDPAVVETANDTPAPSPSATGAPDQATDSPEPSQPREVEQAELAQAAPDALIEKIKSALSKGQADAAERWCVAWLQIKTDQSAALAERTNALDPAEDEAVIALVWSSLAAAGTPQAQAAIAAGLDSGDPALRGRALTVLASVAQPGMPLLESAHGVIRAEARVQPQSESAFARALDAFARLGRAQREDSLQREWIVEQFRRELRTTRRPEQLAQVLSAAAVLGDGRVLTGIAPVFESVDASARLAAFKALSAFEDGPAFDLLRDRFLLEPDESLRLATVEHLAQGPASEERLAWARDVALSDPHEPVARAAATWLCETLDAYPANRATLIQLHRESQSVLIRKLLLAHLSAEELSEE